MSNLWRIVRTTSVANTLQNYGENPNLYTARASYMDVNEKQQLTTRGVVLNIDRHQTLAKVCCGARFGELIRTTRRSIAFFHFVNLLGMTTSILALNSFVPLSASIFISLLWLCGPLHLVLNANTKVLHRQLRFSGHPWFQLYLSAIQTYAIMDLFDYNYVRLFLVVPPLFIGLISLTISDAVYILEEERSCAIIDVFVALLWQIILGIGVRYNLFEGMKARGLIKTMENESTDVLFQNSSLFCGKCASIIVMLVSQIVFRIRHSEQAFSLRGHYSIMSNAEWAKKEARIRQRRKSVLEESVRATTDTLRSSGSLNLRSPQKSRLVAMEENHF